MYSPVKRLINLTFRTASRLFTDVATVNRKAGPSKGTRAYILAQRDVSLSKAYRVTGGVYR